MVHPTVYVAVLSCQPQGTSDDDLTVHNNVPTAEIHFSSGFALQAESFQFETANDVLWLDGDDAELGRCVVDGTP